MNHWKTTLVGVLTILGALGHVAMALLHNQAVDYNVTATTIGAGIGLILAADGKATQ